MKTAHLDMLAVAAYRQLLEQGRRDDYHLCRRFGVPRERIDEVYRLLAELCVIEPFPGRAGAWRAVAPRLAMARLVLPLEDEARRSAAAAEQLRAQLQSLMPVHRTVTGARSRECIDVIDDPATLADVFSEWIAACEKVHILHPSGEQPWSYRDEAPALLAEAAARGVRIRGVYQHGARTHAPTEALVKELTGRGAAFRTVAELPAHAVVFDDDRCLISVPARAAGESGGATTSLAVFHPLIITLLRHVCTTAWAQGIPFLPSEIDDQMLDQLKRNILRLLASGAKDEAVARRLGLSVRTCRRHISDIMQCLGANSRFQAGVEAHSMGLVPATGWSDRAGGGLAGLPGSAGGMA